VTRHTLRCHLGQDDHLTKPLDEDQPMAQLRDRQPGSRRLTCNDPLERSPVG